MLLLHTGRSIFAGYIIMGLVATFAVALRFFGKVGMGQKLAIEDYLILAALVFFYAFIIHFLVGVVEIGGTLVMAEFTNLFAQIDILLKYIYVSELLIITILTLIKMSILVWYWSIFSVHDHFRLPTLIVGSFCLVWGIVWFFIFMFQCRPVSAAWDAFQFLSGQCFTLGNLILVYEVTNITLDIAVLALPIRMVLTVLMSTTKKWLVAGVFALGGFVCLTCALRIYYLYNPADPSKIDFYRGMLWSVIEIGVAFLCCCLPTMRPAFIKNTVWPSVRKWYSSLRSRSGITKLSSAEGKPSGVAPGPEETDKSWLYMVHGNLASRTDVEAATAAMHDLHRPANAYSHRA